MLKVYPRSYWTALPPKSTTVGENYIGLPYFNTAPSGIEFVSIANPVLYIHRDPARELNLLLKKHTVGTGFSDIDYNYAISQNTEGVYVLRGRITKCMQTDKIKVLMLIGDGERPTDTIKKNQEDFLNQKLENVIPTPTLRLGDSGVHVFNLIELLAEKNLYKSRNDGVYGPLVQHAVKELQLQLDLPNLTGEYDDWVYNKLQEREYIET